ncbi:(R)-2-hydroxyglutaryl-CoA dehydratase activator [Thermosulfidibacter takaii ABI70S6]|uniref:(R)-2-hydroxyglutaryl-CoA dehydratase activator n=1 Tax=Thermosulfidibacter takaii (strain DSM 17441 / JCM 13301 / NBRC 103674 / ABI70S6) TaxID=1298851 RepID=A0A0S3QRP7_THET7|nr:acyl-CoA dehydratase activase [Thermosulfidibacter takaii]BAT70995.1 (R)-2-hydroxyglutaryl-CoA dehydratase activator [Thermosulfidibacter takaii ABI70S6]
MKIKSVGIDAGSTAVKIVGLDKDRNIVFKLVEPTEPKVEEQVQRMMDGLKESFDFDSPQIPVVATGYGSNLIKATKKVTEITCHAVGVFNALGSGGTLVDIGGQDSKVIVVGEEGRVLDFVMNDKCAAGTGRFLENVAWRMNIPIDEFGSWALRTYEEVTVSSTCAVFAESEVISLLARGVPPESVIRGLHRAFAKRIAAMVETVGIQLPIMLSGGVAQNPAIVEMLKEELDVAEVLVPEIPQFIGAFGAAILGLQLS